MKFIAVARGGNRKTSNIHVYCIPIGKDNIGDLELLGSLRIKNNLWPKLKKSLDQAGWEIHDGIVLKEEEG